MSNRFAGLRALAAAGFLLFLLTLILIATGPFDPQPVGPVAAEQSPGALTAGPQSTTIRWLTTAAPPHPFTAQLTAHHASGAIDSGYGLVVGSDKAYLATAVAPTGMVSIWQTSHKGETQAILPWQPWPHVGTGDAPNEIWVDVDDTAVAVRINREQLWSGTLDVALDDSQVGWMVVSFEEASVTAVAETFRLFHP